MDINSRGIWVIGTLLSIVAPSFAQNCISLSGSTTCPAFNASSISTDTSLISLFPFLSTVNDTRSFDAGLQQYISSSFTTTKYRNLLGCSNFRTGNTTDLYARYTTSALCNAIVQNSIQPCRLTGAATRPLCADACAEYAQSEQRILASNLCGTSNNNALGLIRADFTNCALPADSLTISCVTGAQNQPDNCGFTNNRGGLCGYCAASSPNATDSCCVFANATSICRGVVLPIVASSALQPITVTATVSSPTTSNTAATSSQSAVNGNNRGLTGGQIAGIVVGSVLGALLLLALIIGGCIFFKRRHGSSPATSVFSQPVTSPKQPQMLYADGVRDSQEMLGVGLIPQGRVARMSALENNSISDRFGGAHAYKSSTSDADTTPRSQQMLGISPPGMRNTSLSSGSQLDAGINTSPSSNNDFTSPESHGHSEQLSSFKDYYSQDEIHPGDLVSTLWAYEPRAGDEFQLERGDMIKVLGIWDDGWATGVRVRQKAEDWRSSGQRQRDSGHTSVSSRPPPDTGDGEVKAFPLVCVCLPQHWRKTIEGETASAS